MIDGLIPCRTSRAHPGKRFGRLTVRSVGRTEDRHYFAVCDCDCGSVGHAAQLGKLCNGETQSCGCWNRDSKITHGLSRNPVFRRWQAMMARCYSQDHVSYPNYGGRGVGVCKRWHDPTNFVKDMTPGFAPELQLDRINTNRDYSPSNCRWVLQGDNLDNTRRSHVIEYHGKAQTLRRWALELGIPRKLLAKRIIERGWPVEKALATPVLSRAETARIANAASQLVRWQTSPARRIQTQN